MHTGNLGDAYSTRRLITIYIIYYICVYFVSYENLIENRQVRGQVASLLRSTPDAFDQAPQESNQPAKRKSSQTNR